VGLRYLACTARSRGFKVWQPCLCLCAVLVCCLVAVLVCRACVPCLCAVTLAVTLAGGYIYVACSQRSPSNIPYSSNIFWLVGIFDE
jgi:hypothetical protein